MIVPDVNLLLYAYNSNSRYHPDAASWLKGVLEGEEIVGFLPVVVFGFVRIITNPRVYASPLNTAEAADIVRSWLAQPPAELLQPGPKHAERVLALLEDTGTFGNLVTDAQIAAACIEMDATLHSSDSDFARFPALRWVNPFARRSKER